MARPLRIQFPGAWHYVTNCSAKPKLLFHCPHDYSIFLDLLDEVHERFQIECHAFCLLKNEYHLLFRTPNQNLSQAMRHINGVYTQQYNGRYDQEGPLFRGRYKTVLVDSETYLLRLNRYIHLVPVLQGFISRAENYSWSSYQYFLNPIEKPKWFYCSETLNRFSSSRKIKRYHEFMLKGVDAEMKRFFANKPSPIILGKTIFAETLRKAS